MDEELENLAHGRLHRFSEFAVLGEIVPKSGAGVYTIWDDAGGLVYVGVAGRNPTGTGLANRLRSHASGRRSGDQFCVYVADHYVMPELTREQVEAIRDGQLSMEVSSATASTRGLRSGSQPSTATRERWRLKTSSSRVASVSPRLNPARPR